MMMMMIMMMMMMICHHHLSSFLFIICINLQIDLSIEASLHAMTLLLRYLILFSNDGVVKDAIPLLSAITLIIVKLYTGKKIEGYMDIWMDGWMYGCLYGVCMDRSGDR